MKRIQDMDKDEFLEIIKELPTTYLEPVIRKIVKDEFAAERQNFWVPLERHYNEHTHLEKCVREGDEKEANHAFVSAMRKRGQAAFNVGFSLAVVAVCGFIFAVFSEGFRHFLLTLMGGGK